MTTVTQATASTAVSAAPAVTIRDLTIVYRTPAGELPAVSGVDLDLPPGTITGLVGESGSGKSTLALSLLGAVQRPGRIAAGSIHVEGLGNLVELSASSLRSARGGEIGYVFQAAQNSLNPLKTVGKQLLDLGRSHRVKDRAALVRSARELLAGMGMDAARVLDSYQHELSGGMRQRVGIMFALVLNAHVLVLDEPTTALDMISQANVLKIVRAVHTERGLTTLLVTHDIGVVAEVAERIAVMYGGVLVEQGQTADVLRSPQHPYARALINAIPRVSGDLSAARPLPGRPPTLGTTPTRGCVFRERCAVYAERQLPACVAEQPPLAPVADGTGRLVACHAVGVGDQQAVEDQRATGENTP